MLTPRALDAVERLIEQVLRASDIALVDIEVAGNRRRPILRIVLNKEGGITLADCARYSRVIEQRLDQRSLIQGRYVLEISSPGLERELRKKKEFSVFAGRRVHVQTRDGASYVGTLQGIEDSASEGGEAFAVILSLAGREALAIPRGEITSARLHVDWETAMRQEHS